MLPLIIGGTAIVGGAIAYLFYGKDPKLAVKPPSFVAPTPKPGTPGAIPKLTTSLPLTPPGKVQPPGNVVMPPVTPTVSGSALSNAAAALVQFLNATPPNKNASPQCLVFQKAFNATGPSVPLATDGKYGPKGQAALQGVITPAVAPLNAFGGAPVAVPASPAPAPDPALTDDVSAAATNLVNYLTANPPNKNSNQATTTFQTAYNKSAAVHLVVDGKYGGKGEGALQAVLTWMGKGQKAPKNVFGAVVKAATFNG